MNESFRRIAAIAARLYAALVLLLGLNFLVLAVVLSGAMHVGVVLAVYLLVLGSVLVALSVFIWRGAMWPMIVVAVGVLGFVILVALDYRSFLVWLFVPVVFGILTAVSIGCKLKARAS
ncbi:MAG TPA: hypothetical protein VFB68_15055 [Xanthobacteraceae bacterium]|nr:hypothetical protein [Xanthobacteraceae bacterium]